MFAQRSVNATKICEYNILFKGEGQAKEIKAKEFLVDTLNN